LEAKNGNADGNADENGKEKGKGEKKINDTIDWICPGQLEFLGRR